MKLEEFKKSIKRRYRNGEDNIGNDFVAPCLKYSKLYRRGTGFFSSSALITYTESIERMISEDIKVEIICSPVIQDKSLIRTLEENQTPEQRKNTIKLITQEEIIEITYWLI